MPPVRRRNDLPLGRDTETTQVIVRNVQEFAAQAVQNFVLTLENFILNGIQTLHAPTLQIKYYMNRFTKPQIFKDGSPMYNDSMFDFDNGYHILKNYRIQIKNHLQKIFPQMTWKTELGENYIGITIANYGIVDDIFTKIESARKDEKDEKDNKKI